MHMEKINEHQVRCLISSQDLLQRKLTAGELRYGAPETRALFKEVLQKASQQYGFNKEEYPVMIEAVPVTEGLLIVLSAVENPEETDPHFVHFHEEDNEEAAREGDAFFQMPSDADSSTAGWRREAMSGPKSPRSTGLPTSDADRPVR